MKKVSTLLLLLIIIAACSSPPSTSPCNTTYLERLALLDPIGDSDFLDSVIVVWRSMRGCKMSLFCENETWVIYGIGNDCEVAFDIEVNGTTERVPIFYIVVETDYVYASGAENNFGIPIRWLEPQQLP